MAKFSEISLDSFGLVEIEKLVPPKETLDKLVKEFQGDLRGENKNNLKFIKFVVSLIKKDNLKLPVLPKIANKILELSYDENSTFNDYANIIRSDSSIALKVIKLANSPMYRGLRNVNDIEIAMSRIGVDGIHELVFSNSLKSIIFKNKKYQKHIQEIWMNSLITALIASKVAKELKLNTSIIYTTALVHKLGSVLIFDIINDFNKDADFIDYLHDDFALRIGLPFNKRLTVNILEKWGFNKKQVNSVKNYDISPVVVAELEHKILYLSQITAGALDVIMLDYDEDSIFPYTFMLREASLEMDVNIFKEIVEDSLSFYNNFLRYLYS